MTLSITCDVAKTFSLAAQQNSYPLLKRIVLHAPVSESESASSVAREIQVTLTMDPEIIAPETWLIDRLESAQSTKLQERLLKPEHSMLAGLTEELLVTIRLSCRYLDQQGQEQRFHNDLETRVLPSDYWGGENQQAELLAAFVQPNTHTVESLTSKVSQLIRNSGENSALDGYQSNTRDRPFLFGAALWSAIFNERIAYVSPPQGWASTGQRIRSAADIMSHKVAACLDTSVLFASCLENMGLNPIVAMTKTHAFAGFWLIDECFPILTNDDPIDLKKRIDSADLVMFETTLVTNDAAVTFNQAIEHAKQLLAEENESDFVMLIDIKQARARKIKPLAIVELLTEGGGDDPVGDGKTVQIGTIPVLPAVKAEEQVIDETPETRVGLWQRKLLDLTKKNPLLNVKTSALKLFCPDPASLEDMLAQGEKFSFISSEDSGLNSDRSGESFTMASGENLHTEFARSQMDKRILVANEPKQRLEKKLVELFRKAKNDLEEGGANTLFVSIGMLRWRETPDSEKSYRAPLILLPVQLERRSAQAKVTLRQLPDEEPIFNLTLIEMLQTDYDIDLSRLAGGLPEDESGVDVEGIWKIVQNAIKEERGFIVVKDIILGSFSFAKYLMWKDLRDRTELLKKSPFVEHLVDRPKDAYQQDSNFIAPNDVDNKVPADSFFAPLNCDSSQMVAVSASVETQDFVLEGPPGTGKSETIANIICHNIAHGRKVLFVAEKMAALQVVYRRMQKINLEHLCLELHSNKANKKAVLDQLRSAWQKRESATQTEWKDKAAELHSSRQHLNQYVNQLHKVHSLGHSPRSAMARAVRYQNSHPLRLDWSSDIYQAPVQNKEHVQHLLGLADNLGIAYEDIADIDRSEFQFVGQADWSNQWRTQTVTLANQISTEISELSRVSKKLSDLLGCETILLTQENISRLSKLYELADLALNKNINFAISSGASSRLNTIKASAPIHAELSTALDTLGNGFTTSTLEKVSWAQLIQDRNSADGILGFLKRSRIRKVLVAAGVRKVKELDFLEDALRTQELLTKLNDVSAEISNETFWRGADASAEEVSSLVDDGEKAFSTFQICCSAFDDQISAASGIRKHLIEGRDLLSSGSILIQTASDLSERVAKLEQLINKASSINFHIESNAPLLVVAERLDALTRQSEKLNRWCHWVGVKQEALIVGLASLVSALEQGIVGPDSARENTETALCLWLAPILIDQSPSLVKFAAPSHEARIQKFKELDKLVAETSSTYVAAIAAGMIPDQNSDATPPEYGVLSRELTKKSRHKPVRALVTEMGGALTDLTPCFMMSPLSVAQFLPVDFALFDLVVFDEASQITTWDAVGAIARGKNVIVVGDPKQMPPSNNFGRQDEDDSDEGDLESILDQALAARLPHLRLTGHYRSKHETLIAFSNAHYYENSLTTFPSAETKKTAVSLHRVDGVYARGSFKNNPVEAKSLVAEVVRRLEGMLAGEPVLSIGVVAINSQQQRLIEDRMDEARRANPQLERFFIANDSYDPIFVKNLESVQGDERDIIFLSLTYGPTEAGGRSMSMNFGPLNKTGGERRLNVAVTRSTTEMVVFSSFDSSMVDLARTQATAVEHLKNYLEFAERGPIALAEYSSASYGVDHFDSDFEMSVAASLREAGWKVQTQVGVSKFRVDLGIVHPDKPGEYIAGVECDGATYHGSASARDRDRVRQAILENLGWNIVRLWSTDYFQEPQHAMRKLSGELDTLLKADRAEMVKREADRKGKSPIRGFPSDYIDLTSDQDSDSLKTVSTPAKEIAASQPLATEKTDVIAKTSLNLAEGALSKLQSYPKELYFNDEHRSNFKRLVMEVLQIKNGVTLHELTLDLANLHGLTRSSKKQRQHLRELILPWAGFWREGEEKTTVWLSKEDITDEIHWRGYKAFGVERNWQELCYQEQLGFARQALKMSPADPVSWMFVQFEMSRRYDATVDAFKLWLSRVSEAA
jgi:very-short-patch-repair endonuclease